ncbi:hypothetical protein SLEP1_g25849 [Rubroshorea leprosula]|uniref:Uncharacterized protein n=1 Tax=Rubroshorea leprosula TaxID=152421 RepID=A0AAV5JU17_9ROSI|nr:hypothetical protein SLEP1_g25849 [Rubroshorea leprosula]
MVVTVSEGAAAPPMRIINYPKKEPSQADSPTWKIGKEAWIFPFFSCPKTGFGALEPSPLAGNSRSVLLCVFLPCYPRISVGVGGEFSGFWILGNSVSFPADCRRLLPQPSSVSAAGKLWFLIVLSV